MAFTYKILTQNGVDNTNIDGARAEYFAAGMRDGIVKGSLNECAFTVIPSNGINLDTGVLLIAGHPIVITEGRSWTFTSRPSNSERRAVIAEITVDNNSTVTFRVFEQLASIALVKNNMYKHENGSGTYQVEIGRFTLTTSGLVENLTRTIDVITGGGTADSELHWGTITAYALGHNEDPEADFEQRYDEEQGYMVTDVSLGIPSGSIDNLDDTLSSTSHNAIENQAVTNALGGYYTKTETDNLLDGKADLFNLQQDFAAKTVTIGSAGTNTVMLSTPDSTTTHIWAPNNNIVITAGQSSVPNKNIILTPNGSVICHSDLKFAFGHTAKVPTPTANEDAVPKSYVDNISIPIGSVIDFTGHSSFIPTNYLLCNGQAVSRTTYAELFAIIGTVWGSGDGSTTFNVPDLRNRVTVGAGDLYPNGRLGGERSHTITQDEAPRVQVPYSANASGGSYGAILSNSIWTSVNNPDGFVNLHRQNAQTEISLMQPFGAMYKIIRAK